MPIFLPLLWRNLLGGRPRIASRSRRLKKFTIPIKIDSSCPTLLGKNAVQAILNHFLSLVKERHSNGECVNRSIRTQKPDKLLFGLLKGDFIVEQESVVPDASATVRFHPRFGNKGLAV